MLDSADSALDQQVGALVVGAGPVGLSHALWLRQYDVDVLVIDADLRSHAREWVTLGPDALSVLRRIGIQSELDHARVDYDAVVVTPLRASRASGHRPSRAKRPRLLRLPPVAPEQAPLSLVNRAVLEQVLELRAREFGVQIEHGQRLQRVEIRPSHCEARVVPSSEGTGRAEHPKVTPGDSARRLIAHWVIGTDGYRSVVRRDLRSGFRSVADPRTASIVRVTGRRSVDVEGAVQISVGEHAVHTVWPLGGEQLLWVMQATGPELPAGLELDARSHGLGAPLALSTDPVRCGTVTEAFVEREAELVGIQVQEVLSGHAIHYRPCVADPQGRGRAWTSGPAAQLIAPALGHDDALGLLEVPDLGLLLGFGADDAMPGLPTLTPRLYHERRTRIQQHALGAHPLAGEPSGPHHWSNHDRGSIHDREAVANVLAFLAPMAPAARKPEVRSRVDSTSVRA